eukprot:349990-Chlamydomonas_euryale.AAC.14
MAAKYLFLVAAAAAMAQNSRRRRWHERAREPYALATQLKPHINVQENSRHARCLLAGSYPRACMLCQRRAVRTSAYISSLYMREGQQLHAGICVQPNSKDALCSLNPTVTLDMAGCDQV